LYCLFAWQRRWAELILLNLSIPRAKQRIVTAAVCLWQLGAFAKTGRVFFLGMSFLYTQTYFTADIQIFFLLLLLLICPLKGGKGDFVG